jgi:hypothetical protein
MIVTDHELAILCLHFNASKFYKKYALALKGKSPLTQFSDTGYDNRPR